MNIINTQPPWLIYYSFFDFLYFISFSCQYWDGSLTDLCIYVFIFTYLFIYLFIYFEKKYVSVIMCYVLIRNRCEFECFPICRKPFRYLQFIALLRCLSLLVCIWYIVAHSLELGWKFVCQYSSKDVINEHLRTVVGLALQTNSRACFILGVNMTQVIQR